MFEADALEDADAREAEGLVQVERGLVAGLDIGDHLPIAGAGAGLEQCRQQFAADAGVQVVRVHVDRVLQRVTVGGAFAERDRIGIADDDAVQLGDEMRQPALQRVLAPALEIIAVQRLDLECAETVLDVMGIDRQHGRHIGLGRRPHKDFGGFFKHRLQAA